MDDAKEKVIEKNREGKQMFSIDDVANDLWYVCTDSLHVQDGYSVLTSIGPESPKFGADAAPRAAKCPVCGSVLYEPRDAPSVVFVVVERIGFNTATEEESVTPHSVYSSKEAAQEASVRLGKYSEFWPMAVRTDGMIHDIRPADTVGLSPREIVGLS